MIGDDIAAVLPELQAQALSRMTDTVTVTRPSAGGELNESTGLWADPDAVPVWSGPCRLRMPSGSGSDVESGEAPMSLRSAVLSLPLDGTGVIAVGDVAAVSGRGSWVVKGLHEQTDSTARRLQVEAVSREQ